MIGNGDETGASNAMCAVLDAANDDDELHRELSGIWGRHFRTSFSKRFSRLVDKEMALNAASCLHRR